MDIVERAKAITIKTPEGEVKFDAQKMEAFAKQMEEMAKKWNKLESKRMQLAKLGCQK